VTTTCEAIGGPLDGERFEVRPGQEVFAALEGESGKRSARVHRYAVVGDRLLYEGALSEIAYLRSRVAELEGRPV